MSKYNYNKDYFQKIDDPEKAYWLGFLYADGCINRKYKNEKLTSMQLEVSLSIKDELHLQKLASALDSNIPIKERAVHFKDSEYGACRLLVCNSKICYDLIDKGCTPQKSLTVKMPDDNIVPLELKKDFLRGYFDGNGCIHTKQQKNKLTIEVTIATGNEEMLKGISSFLFAQKAVTVIPKIFKDKRGNTYSMYYYGDSAKDFLDYLYEDCELFLDRKHKQYVDYYKDYTVSRSGVHWHAGNKAYVVTISMDNKNHRIGQSKNLQEAIRMRKEAEIRKTQKCLLNQ